MSEVDGLRSMVGSFRMTELHTLLTFAGKSRSGRKSELQKRALELVSIDSADIKLKIRDLSNAMYKSLGTSPSVNPYSANFTPPPTSPGSTTDSPSPAAETATASSASSTPVTTKGSKSKNSTPANGNGKSKAKPKAKPKPKAKAARRVETSDEDEEEDSDDDEEAEEEAPKDDNNDFDAEADGDDPVSSSADSSSAESSRSSSPIPVKSKKKPPPKKVVVETPVVPPPLPPEAIVSPVTGRARRRAAMVAYANITDICKETEREQEQEIMRHEKEFRKNGKKDKKNGKDAKNKEKDGKEKDKDWKDDSEDSSPTKSAAPSTATAKTTLPPPTISRVTTAPLTPPPSDVVITRPVVPTATVQPTNLSVPGYRGGPPGLGGFNSSAATASSGPAGSSTAPSRAPGYAAQLSAMTFPKAYAASIPPAQRSIFTPMPNMSTYSAQLSAAAAASAPPTDSKLMYPPFPDVKLAKLPFFKVLATLMKPSALQPTNQARFQEQKLHFYLSPHQAGEILESGFRDSNGRPDYRRQIQMRFSMLETSCEQEDNFPSSICVKVNHKLQPLPNPIPTNKPGVEPKRPPKPINITSLCKLSATLANYIDVSWAVEIGRGFTVSVYYVDKLTTRDLMKELRSRGTRLPDYTRALIKEKLNDKDSDISTTSCKVTLACPLGKMRMTYPCRSNNCDHLQCFDANLYLMMNERKPKWLCPVCNKPAPYDSLLIDGYFTEMLSSNRLPAEEHEIVLHNDGTWEPMPPPAKEGSEENGGGGGRKTAERRTVAEKIQASSSAAAAASSSEAAVKKGADKVETFSVDDDEDEEESSAKSKGKGSSASSSPAPDAFQNDKRPIDCITLDSDESDAEEVTSRPAAKRPRATAFLDSDEEELGSCGASDPKKTAAPATSAEDDIICLDSDD